MFKLQTEYYCEGCPDFEADVTTFQTPTGNSTYINCVHRQCCHNMATRIKEKMIEKEARKNAKVDI